MKKYSTFLLKVALVMLAIPIILLCIFFVPTIGYPKQGTVPDFAITYVRYVVPFIFYLSALPYFYALFQSYILLKIIDHKQAFSQYSVQALKYIKYCAIIICILHIFNLPLFYIFAQLEDAPGVIFIGCIVPFASMVIAIFSNLLEKLLKEAIELKHENDLTI